MARLNAANNFIVTVLTVTICLVCFISHGHLANAAECHSDTVTVTASSAAAETCASIGYSTKCCPPEGDCTVTARSTSGSPCKCNFLCHNIAVNDCCKDIFCPKGIPELYYACMHAISYDLNFSIESAVMKLIIMQSQKRVKILDVVMMKIIMPQVVMRNIN